MHDANLLVFPAPALSTRDSLGIVYLTDDALFDACGVRIAFTGRHGGVSAKPYDSLNLGTHVGDDLDAVDRNRNQLLKALAAPADCQLVSLNQVHGTHVDVVHDASVSELARVRAVAADGADGIAVSSQATAVAALLCFADCVPIIMVAPNGAFAVVHAGWRGVVGRIVDVAIGQLLALDKSSDASDINVYIGPHIRSECFEVSNDLAEQFASAFGDACVPANRHVSLVDALRITIADSGVSAERIVDCGICTMCNSEDFFSYRASGGECGRHGAIAFKVR